MSYTDQVVQEEASGISDNHRFKKKSRDPYHAIAETGELI
jgi:hypothetical protein